MTRRQRAASRISRGSVQIGWRIARWPWEEKAWRERAGRLAVQAFGGWAVWRLAEAYPAVPEVALGWWLIAAYRAADAEEDDNEAEAEQREQHQEQQDLIVGAHTIEQLREALADTVRELAGGSTGAHLDAVMADWQEQGLIHHDRTLSEFRAFVEGLGVRVRASQKVRGLNRMGIRLSDLPPPRRAPPPRG